MAIKVKKRVPKHKEATEPDQIYTFTQRAFNYIEENRKVLLGSLVVLLVGIAVVAALIASHQESETESGAEVLQAVQLLRAPVGEQAEEDSDQPTFESETAKNEEIRALAGTALGEDARPAAHLLAGTAAFRLGDEAAAQAHFAAAAADVEQTPLVAMAAMQAAAVTQLDSDDLAAAQGTLEQLATLRPSMRSFAELEAARLTEAAGEYGTALELYRVLAERGTEFDAPDVDQLAGQLASQRVELLEVILGVQEEPSLPVETEDDSDTAEGPTGEATPPTDIEEAADSADEADEVSQNQAEGSGEAAELAVPVEETPDDTEAGTGEAATPDDGPTEAPEATDEPAPSPDEGETTEPGEDEAGEE